MLKHLYKSFIISIISGSLLTIQPTVVFAAGTNTTDQNGVITNTQSHKFEKIKDEDMLASITMLGGGFIAGRMVSSYEPITTDVMIAGAAGVAFIAGEIMSNMKFKGTIDEMTIEVQKKSDGTVNEEQIKRLQDLKKSYEEAKKTTKTKKTLQLAAAAGFGIAAATAIYLSMTEEGMVGSCRLALNSARTSLTTCVSTGVSGNADSVGCGACQIGLNAWEGVYNSYYTTRKPPGKSSLKDTSAEKLEMTLNKPLVGCKGGATAPAIASGVESVCKPSVLKMIKNQTEADPKNLVKTSSILNSILKIPYYSAAPVIHTKPINYFEKALDIFFPSAKASWIPMLGLTAGVAAAFFAVTAATAVEIDMLMFVPTNRAIAFGLFAATSYMAAKSSDNVIKKLDGNITKIDKILNDMNKMANGVKAQNITNQQIKIQTIDKNGNEQMEFSKNGTVKTPCLTGNSTENCASTTDALKNMPGFANLPDSFKDLATQTTSLGDRLSGATGISGSALSSAEALGNKQNAIAKLLKGRQEAFLQKNKIDLKKEEGKLQDRLNARARGALQKHGMTATGLMSSIGGSTINPSDKSVTDLGSNAGKGLTPTAAVVDISAPAGEDKEKDTLNLDFKEDTAGMAAVDMSGGTTSAAPEYQIDSNEINGQNGPSLFEVISSRYIKSGYPKLLEEEPAKN